MSTTTNVPKRLYSLNTDLELRRRDKNYDIQCVDVAAEFAPKQMRKRRFFKDISLLK